MIFDENGVSHEVYNKTEVRQLYKQHQWLENWQVRTLCSKYDRLSLLGHDVGKADCDDTTRVGHVITCVRCVALECDHGIRFDKDMAEGFRMTSAEIKNRWPRLEGECTKGCGYRGIAYASFAHYVYGDW